MVRFIRDRWVHPGSLGFAQGVVWFVRGRRVHSRAPWRSFGSSGVVGFARIRSGCLWVHPASLGSHALPLGVVRFTRVLWVHSGTLWGSLGSSRIDEFIRVRPWGHWGRWFHSGTSWGHWVHPGSMDSLGFSLELVGFILSRWVDSGSPLGSSGVVGFTRLRHWGRWVHPETLGFALGYVWFIRDRWVHSGSPWGSLSSSGLLGFTRVRRWVLPRSFGLLGCAQVVVGFTGVRPWGSSGSLWCAMGVVGFIQCRWIHPESKDSLGL